MRVLKPTSPAPTSNSTCTPAPRDAAKSSLRSTLARSREAQRHWSAVPLRERVKLLRSARRLLAQRVFELAGVASRRLGSPARAIAAEVMPLLDACRFLEREATRILAPRRLGRRGRPAWLFGVELTVYREPHGVVLIVGPSNYPLFLVGVQALQALVAGNAVALKPAPGASPAANALRQALVDAGLDPRLLAVLPESADAAREAIDRGVDKVVLTGSATTGRAVLEQLAPRLVPATMELSGCDAVFVLRGADLDRVVDALRFGVAINDGATCIAPRRVFVSRDLAPELETRLARSLASVAPMRLSRPKARRLQRLVDEAVAQGARRRAGGDKEPHGIRPVLVCDVTPDMKIARVDVFAPVLSLMPVDDDDEAVAASNRCAYALGATVFGPERAARDLAARLQVGVVVVNDLIAPTADPRLPFGGRGESGFGVTRGAEGLLEMTVPKAVSVRRRGGWRHFKDESPGDARLFAAYVALVHESGLVPRLRRLGELLRALVTWRQKDKKPS